MDERARSRSAVLAAALLLALLVPTSAASSRPHVSWHRTVRNGLESVAVAPDGSVYVAGSVRQYRKPWDEWAILRRYSRSGAVEWTRWWNPPGAWSNGVDVEALPDGSVVLAGAMGPNHLEGGLWFLRRYAADGRLLWRRTAPRWREGGAVRISDMAVGAGMIVVAGTDFGCCDDPYRDGWVRAYDLDGAGLWTDPFEFPDIDPDLYDDAQSIAIGSLGRVYVTGWANLEPQMAASEPVRRIVVVQKLGPSGGRVWTWTMQPHGPLGYDSMAGVSAHGEVLVATARFGGPVVPRGRSTGRAWLGRFDFGGMLRWSRTWGDDSLSAAEPAAIAVGDHDRVYVVGSARDPSSKRLLAFVRTYAPGGRLLWSTTLAVGNDSMVGSDVASADGRLLVTGTRMTGRWQDRRRDGYVWAFDP